MKEDRRHRSNEKIYNFLEGCIYLYTIHSEMLIRPDQVCLRWGASTKQICSGHHSKNVQSMPPSHTADPHHANVQLLGNDGQRGRYIGNDNLRTCVSHDVGFTCANKIVESGNSNGQQVRESKRHDSTSKLGKGILYHSPHLSMSFRGAF